jgi:hypothetical protein
MCCLIELFFEQLCNLPAKPCVVEILERFLKTFCINYVCDPQERELLNNKDPRDKQKIEKILLRLPPENVYVVKLYFNVDLDTCH